MEKNELGSIIVYLVMMLLIFLVCQTVISIAITAIEEAGGTLKYPIGYAILCFIISVVIFTLFYELGHILGAKLGHYSLTYLNLFGLCFYKVQNKWSFKISFAFDGLFSETRFAPKENKKTNPLFFLWGGLCMFVVTILIALAIYAISAIPAEIRYATLIYVGMGLILLLYNIIPMRTDILNDGYRIKLLGSKENAEAYNEFMRIEENFRQGIVTEKIKEYERISPMTVLINNYAYYNHLNHGRYKEAEHIVDMILENAKDVETKTLYRFKFQKLYFVILNNSIENASNYYWNVLDSLDRKYLSRDNSIASRRVYLLVSGLINDSYSESKIAIEGMKKRINKLFNNTEKEVELKLYSEDIEKVSKHLNVNDLINLF